MVDEAGGPADVHAVTNVLVGNVLWVEPELVPRLVHLDCPLPSLDLVCVPVLLVRVKLQEIPLRHRLWLLELIEGHEVVIPICLPC